MATHNVEKIVCCQCQAVLDVGDSFCRRCGAATSGLVRGTSGASWPGGAAPPHPASVPTHSRPKLIESRWGVLLMIFAVLGPLGLPMLWRSSQFSRAWKVILTVIVLTITLLIGGLVWYVVDKLLAALGELSVLGGA